MAAIATHCVVVSTIFIWFCKGQSTFKQNENSTDCDVATTTTLLCEPCFSIAQIFSASTVSYIERATNATNSHVKTWIEADGLHRTRIRIVPSSREKEVTSMFPEQRAKVDCVPENESQEGLVLHNIHPATRCSSRTVSSSVETPLDAASLCASEGEPLTEALSRTPPTCHQGMSGCCRGCQTELSRCEIRWA